MSDYTVTTNFGAKDSLPSSNPAKVVRGSEFTTEFTNIQTAVATKADTAGDTFTGVVNFSNDIAVNTNTLFVDVSTAKVGIGTASPAYELDVTGSAQLAGGDLILRSDSLDADTQSIRFENVANDDRSAYIRADYEANSNGNGIGLAFGTNDSGQDGQTRMVLTRIGKVGIGTTSPSTDLHIKNTSAAQLLIESGETATGFLLFGDASDLNIGSVSYDHSDNSMRFETDDTERMRIDSSGDLLVGTTEQNAFNGGFSVKTGTIPYINVGHASSVASGNYYAAFRHGTNTIGTITQSGTTGVLYNTSSDERLKENITDSADAGSKVDAIQIRQFDWKSDGSHQDYGVIAQELINVAPEAVSEGDTEEDMMGVDYSKLVPMLIKEVQSLRSRVAELENV